MGDVLMFVFGFWLVILAIAFLIVAWKLALIFLGLPVGLFLLLHPDTGGYVAWALLIVLAVFVLKDHRQEKAKAKQLDALKKKREEELRLEHEEEENDFPPLSDVPNFHSSL